MSLNGNNPGNPTNSGKFSLEKATFFRGKANSESLKERYGYNCLYCGSFDHWYANCNIYWGDVCHGKVSSLPPNHDKKGSKFIPPAQNVDHQPRPSGSTNPQPHQSNGSIKKIDVPEANNGKVHLDSGSTINVSDKSKFLTITKKLDTPLTVSLAISKFVAPIDSIGHLRIPTPVELDPLAPFSHASYLSHRFHAGGTLPEAAVCGRNFSSSFHKHVHSPFGSCVSVLR
ncbi:hypothetical protein PCANC_03701 [Puccinia coronata f. sp. avenae]|uniref:Uncharacterized protein n=1 Tax=Puccinia coronata f. sp. avenae TaxID=200324 RepID=A0A2N5VXS0_9BASI|nr:hypothetical protein PCANC_03701 [Puccinia coronata f. sp. avenae]